MKVQPIQLGILFIISTVVLQQCFSYMDRKLYVLSEKNPNLDTFLELLHLGFCLLH
jgi:hypothetical protein